MDKKSIISENLAKQVVAESHEKVYDKFKDILKLNPLDYKDADRNRLENIQKYINDYRPIVAGVENRKMAKVIELADTIKIMSPKSNFYSATHTEPKEMANTYKKMFDKGYYTDFQDIIAGKTQTPSMFFEKLTHFDEAMNQKLTYSKVKQITTFNRVLDAAKNMEESLKSGKGFATFDIESTGGANAHGFQELDEITEFSYSTRDANGSAMAKGNFRSVVGVSDEAKYKEIKTELESLQKIPQSQWTTRDRVLVGNHSKYGEAAVSFEPIDGTNESLWKVNGVTNKSGEHSTPELALKGLEKRREVGLAQQKAADAMGGVFQWKKEYYGMIDDMQSGVSFSGHNTTKFDLQMFARDIAKNDFNKAKTLNLNTAGHFDMLAALRIIGQEEGKDFLAKENMGSLTKTFGLTQFQQETLTQLIFEQGESHTALGDEEQFSQFFTTKDNKGLTLFNKVFGKLKKIESDPNRVEFKYAGANKQLFHIASPEQFSSYNTKAAMNFSIDAITKEIRTANGYNISGDGVTKELFGQTGSMKKGGLATFNVLQFENPQELIGMLNPDIKANITVPEMGIAKGYALVVTQAYDQETLKRMGLEHFGSAQGQHVYLHDSTDSLYSQMSNAMPVAELDTSYKIPKGLTANEDIKAWRPTKNVASNDLLPFNVVNGKVIPVENKGEQKALEGLYQNSHMRYANDPASDFMRKIKLTDYEKLNNAFLQDAEGKARDKNGVKEYTKRMSELISKGKALTLEEQKEVGDFREILGHVADRKTGRTHLYTETINKAMNVVNTVQDQKPVIEMIKEVMGEMPKFEGDSNNAKATKNLGFTNAYNAVMEHILGTPEAIVNGTPTAVLGKDLNYINVPNDVFYSKEKNFQGVKVAGQELNYKKIQLDGGNLRADLVKHDLGGNSASVKDNSVAGFTELNNFRKRLNKSKGYEGVLDYTEKELDIFLHSPALNFEDSIKTRLKEHATKMRASDLSFGYMNETNMTHDAISTNKQFVDFINRRGKEGIEELRNIVKPVLQKTEDVVHTSYNNSSVEDLVNKVSKIMMPFSKDEYSKTLSGLDESTIKGRLYNYDLTQQAVKSHYTDMFQGIHNTDIQINLNKEGQFTAIRGGEVHPFNMPMIKHQNGVLYSEIDNTVNIMQPYLDIEAAAKNGHIDPSKIGFKSSYEVGLNKSYKFGRTAKGKMEKGADMMNVLKGWVSNTKQAIRETSPALEKLNPQSFLKGMEVNVDELTQALYALSNGNDNVIKDLQQKGLIPDNFFTNLKGLLKPEHEIKKYSQMTSSQRNTLGPVAPAILQEISKKYKMPNGNVTDMLENLSMALKDVPTGEGSLYYKSSVMVPFAESSNMTRSIVNQMPNSYMYKADEIEAGLNKFGFSNPLDKKASNVSTSHAVSRPSWKYLSNMKDEATGYEMMHSVSAKYLAMDQLNLKKLIVNEFEKDDNAFVKQAKELGGTAEEIKEASKTLYQKAMKLNVHEQELILDSRLAETIASKFEQQSIDTKKGMIVSHENNLLTIESLDHFEKMVPTVNAKGEIEYKTGREVKYKEELFKVQGYDKETAYGAKYDGLLRQRFTNLHGEEVDAKTINKMTSGKGFTSFYEIEDFLQGKGLKSKYVLARKNMVDRAKINISGVEKGVTDSMMMGAGSVSSQVKKFIHADDKNIVLSDDYLEHYLATGKYDAAQVGLIKEERHSLSRAMFEHIDSVKNTGSSAIVNQGFISHGNVSAMLYSDIGHLKALGGLEDDKTISLLNKAFEGMPSVNITSEGIEHAEDISGQNFSVAGIEEAMDEHKLNYTEGKTKYRGVQFKGNEAIGSVHYGSFNHIIDYGGGVSKGDDANYARRIDEIEKNIAQTNIDMLAENLTPEGRAKLNAQLEGHHRDLSKTLTEKEYMSHIERGAIYSDRADMILNRRQYDSSMVSSVESKLTNQEFKEYMGHAITPDSRPGAAVVKDSHKFKSVLGDWTTQIKDSMYVGASPSDQRRIQSVLGEIDAGMDAMEFNSLSGTEKELSKKNLINASGKKQSFREVAVNEIEVGVRGTAEETIAHKNNIYNQNLLVNIGEEYGDHKLIALSAEQGSFSGKTLIKSDHKVAMQKVLSGLEKVKEAKGQDVEVARNNVIDSVKELYQLQGKDVTGKEGMMEGLMKIRMNNSTLGKASMLTVTRGEGYENLTSVAEKYTNLQKYNTSSLDKALFGNKSLLKHLSEGKAVDAEFLSEEAFEKMDYFKRSNMDNALKGADFSKLSGISDEFKNFKHVKKMDEGTLKGAMKEYLSVYGDVGLTQRFPIIQEGSVKPVAMYLDESLHGSQVKVLGHTALSMKMDIDGDTIAITKMKTKQGKSAINYNIEKAMTGTVSDANLKSLGDSQRAYMIDRAVNANSYFDDKVQQALSADRKNGIIDLRSVSMGELIDNKVFTALNGSGSIGYEKMLEHRAKVKDYVSEAEQNLNKRGVTDHIKNAQEYNDEVVKVINNKHQIGSAASGDLIQSFGISQKYKKLETEKLAKILKNTIGEANVVNKHLREAFQLTHERASEGYSLKASILQSMVYEAEEATISSKKLMEDIDPARAEKYRNAITDIFKGKQVNNNVANVKSFMKDYASDKVYEQSKFLRSVYTDFAKETEGFKGDKDAMVNHVLESYGETLHAMSNNSGLSNINDFFKLGESTNGVAAERLKQIKVGKHDDSIKGQLTKMLMDIDPNRGQVLSKEVFATNKQNALNHLDLDDGRQWLEREAGAGQTVSNVIKSVGDIFHDVTKDLSGKQLALGALGIAGAYMVAGFAGGNPAPAQTQAQQASEDQYYSVPSLQDDQPMMAPGGQEKGYVININARTAQGKEHATGAIRSAMHQSIPTDVNIAMNINDNHGNINDRYIESLIAGTI
jgi:hypothetical protein